MSKIYLDACIYIAILAGKAAEEYTQALRNKIDNGKLSLIASSVITLEVWEHKLSLKQREIFRGFLSNDYVEIINPDTNICTRAARILDNKQKINKTKKKGIGQIDAIHIQTAIDYKADEFHTDDEGILNRNIASLYGINLKIVRPDESRILHHY